MVLPQLVGNDPLLPHSRQAKASEQGLECPTQFRSSRLCGILRRKL